MKEFAKIDVRLREHPKVLRAGDEAAWLYLCAILWSKASDTDGHVPEAMASRLTGLRKPFEAISRLVDVGLLEVVEDGWLIHDYLDHQESAADRRGKRDARSMAGAMGAAKRWHGNTDSKRHSGSHSAPNGKPIAEIEEEEEREEETSSERPEVARLTGLLSELMLANNPKAKTAPQSKGWRDPIRLLLDRDDHSEGDIEQVIRWCQADEFWRSNILSPSKLRKQFETLWMRTRASSGSNGMTEQAARQQRRLASIQALTTGGAP